MYLNEYLKGNINISYFIQTIKYIDANLKMSEITRPSSKQSFTEKKN